MADTQLRNAAIEPAPKVYLAPADAEFTLKSVRATFTDNGAGTDWLPQLTIISDSGQEVAFASDQGVKVTAGQGAKVAWFPGVKPAAAAAAASTTFVRAFGTTFTPQSVPAGTTANCSYTNVVTSDASQASWSTTTVANDTLTLHSNGWALLMASCSWPAGVKVDYRVYSQSGFDFPHDAIGGSSLRGTDFYTFSLPNWQDFAWLDITNPTGQPLHVRMTNADAGASGPAQAAVACMYWPGLST